MRSLSILVLLSLCSLVSVLAQAPTPYYTLTLNNDPRSAAGGSSSAAYTWELYDQSDVACGISQYHQGLVELNGGPPDNPVTVPPTVTPYGVPQYLNLSSSSGPNSVGSVLPVIGGPSTAANPGWSLELTFKPAIQETFGKVIDIGSTRTNGNCLNDIYFGWNGGSQNMAVGVCDSTGASNGNNNFGGVWAAGSWYHVVIVFQQLGDGMTMGVNQSNWQMYQNGVLSSTINNTYYPQAVPRQNANLGLSGWSDSLWAGLIDTFNVYNSALTASQVSALSAAALGSATPTVACTTQSTSSAVLSSTVYYQLNFSTSPLVSQGLTTSGATYQWLQSDSSDSTALQSAHQGLLLLNGSNPVGGFINMSATSGASSVSSTPLMPIGGMGSGSITDGTMGWSFEVVYKPFSINSYAKLYDINNAAGTGGIDDILYGYNGGTGDYEVDYVNGGYNSQATQYILSPAGPSASTLTLNTWYHHVWVIQYNTSASVSKSADFATYYSYLNGQLIGTLLSAVYPPYLQRIDAFMGRSAWNDTQWDGEVDTFRVFSVALTPQQVTTLYQASLTGASPISQPTAQSSSGGAAVVASSSSAAAAGGASSSAGATSAPSTRSASSSSSSAAPGSVTSTPVVSPTTTSTSTPSSVVPSSSTSVSIPNQSVNAAVNRQSTSLAVLFAVLSVAVLAVVL